MADWRTMVDSLQSPMRRLQGEQRSPRTCPVVWLWSMCQFSSFKFGFRQIAQRLPCETAILCSSSSVIPYRVFRSYERLFFRASSLLLSLLIFLVTFMWSLFFSLYCFIYAAYFSGSRALQSRIYSACFSRCSARYRRWYSLLSLSFIFSLYHDMSDWRLNE